MSAEASERSLRRLVADLARCQPSDQQAVLAELEEDEQRRVRALLSEFIGPSTVDDSAISTALPDLSPWLAERLEGASAIQSALPARRGWGRRQPPPPSVAPFSMTSHARAVLTACAQDLHTAPNSGEARTPSRFGPTARRAGAIGWPSLLHGKRR